ncbi:MAG: CBS and ACT domain-containing protein [Desulfobacterales bacterium]|jgi:acetoin utilization protein AcuB
MLVKNWMRQPAITIDADDRVANAAMQLQKHEIHMLPVLQQGQLVGILTERDIRIAAAGSVASKTMAKNDHTVPGLKVKTIMTPDPVTVPYDYTLEETVEKLLVYKISGLPVVDRHQKVIGVITTSDLFQLILILTGYGKRGLQLGIEAADRPGSLEAITDMIRDYGGRITSILSTRERADRGCRRLYIRFFDIDKPGLAHLKEVIRKKSALLYIVDYNTKEREWFLK